MIFQPSDFSIFHIRLKAWAICHLILLQHQNFGKEVCFDFFTEATMSIENKKPNGLSLTFSASKDKIAREVPLRFPR